MDSSPPATGPDTTRAARMVAVVGAAGGAGTSTLAAALARSLRRQVGETTLVDLHTPGGGVDVLLGVEDAPGARWPDLADARGTVDPPDLLAALPRWAGVPVLSASRYAAAPPQDDVVLDVVTALVRAGQRIVLDLPGPRSWDRAPGNLLRSADVVVLVVPRSARGVAGGIAARRVLDAVTRGPVRLVAGLPSAGRVDAGEVARAVGGPLAAVLDRDRHLPAALERGEGPRTGARTPVGRAARGLVGALSGVAGADRTAVGA